jgi:hypothetical protein
MGAALSRAPRSGMLADAVENRSRGVRDRRHTRVRDPTLDRHRVERLDDALRGPRRWAPTCSLIDRSTIVGAKNSPCPAWANALSSALSSNSATILRVDALALEPRVDRVAHRGAGGREQHRRCPSSPSPGRSRPDPPSSGVPNRPTGLSPSLWLNALTREPERSGVSVSTTSRLASARSASRLSVLPSRQTNLTGCPRERGLQRDPGEQLGHRVAHTDVQAHGGRPRAPGSRRASPAHREDVVGVGVDAPPQVGEDEPAAGPVKEGVPICSRSAICLLIVGCVSPSVSHAEAMLPPFAVAQKHRR